MARWFVCLCSSVLFCSDWCGVVRFGTLGLKMFVLNMFAAMHFVFVCLFVCLFYWLKYNHVLIKVSCTHVLGFYLIFVVAFDFQFLL